MGQLKGRTFLLLVLLPTMGSYALPGPGGCEADDEIAHLQVRSKEQEDKTGEGAPYRTRVVEGFPGKLSDDTLAVWCQRNRSNALPLLERSSSTVSEGSLCCERGNLLMTGSDPAGDDRAELERLINESVHLPEHCGQWNISDVKIFTFAIGSLFNNGSVETTRFKQHLKQRATSSSCLSQTVLQDMFQASAASPFYFATAADVSRRWTYPSGAPNGFLAVSVHDEPGKSVFGGLQTSTFDDVVLNREREKDYDYIVLDPTSLIVHWNESSSTTLRQAYGECDALFPFAYGFTEVVNTTSDIFTKIPRFDKYNDPDKQVLELIARRNASCAALVPDQVEDCKSVMEANRGFVLVQSYIDVIISGLLDSDPSGKAAGLFVSTTIWPLQDLQDSKLHYINDRACPQNGNPLYTPPAYLENNFNAGTSSVYEHDIELVWQKVDELLSQTGILQYRSERSKGKNCVSLGMADKDLIARFTDEFVYGEANEQLQANEIVRMVSPWQRPFV